MTDKEYREHPGISRSQLFKISETPEKFKYEMEKPSPPTEALLFGQAFHELVLQPESFSDDFAVAPNVDRRTKSGKEEYAEFLENCGEKAIISADTYEIISRMSDKLKNNFFAKKLLWGEHEKPFFWTDEMTGEPCKCRVDAISEISGKNYIVDLKTALNAEDTAFMNHAIKYGYHLQAAMYREGVKAATGIECGFVFIVIEKSPPYAINIFEADNAFISYGYDVFRELIGVYHDCKLSGNWYGYEGKFNNINKLNLPSYLAKEVQ